jgi:hypothetical protein
MRKGYRSEYLAKKLLIEKYGKQNVLKIAIGGCVDFLILTPNKNKIEKIVEVKQTAKNKYYPRENEKKQLELIKKFATEHNIPIELWIKFKNRKGFEVIEL